MTSPIPYPVDDKDLDDAALWAVIDSAAASHSTSKSGKPLALKYTNHQAPSRSPPPKFSKNPRNHYSGEKNITISPQCEVLREQWIHHRPHKIARTCISELSETSPMAVVKHLQRTPKTPAYSTSSSPETSKTGMFSVVENSPGSDMNCWPAEDKDNVKHSLLGKFPSVSLFKEYQNAAMAILEKTDYTIISGNPFIKKSGWRKISCYFNISFEIKDKTIEFDENRNVHRAEFIVRAHMQSGRFSDGWGSCERREKRFSKPNHDIPSTAETRAKNKACQVASLEHVDFAVAPLCSTRPATSSSFSFNPHEVIYMFRKICSELENTNLEGTTVKDEHNNHSHARGSNLVE